MVMQRPGVGGGGRQRPRVGRVAPKAVPGDPATRQGRPDLDPTHPTGQGALLIQRPLKAHPHQIQVTVVVDVRDDGRGDDGRVLFDAPELFTGRAVEQEDSRPEETEAGVELDLRQDEVVQIVAVEVCPKGRRQQEACVGHVLPLGGPRPTVEEHAAAVAVAVVPRSL